MPAIELSLGRLEKLLGKPCKVEDLELDLQWIGLDLDDVQEDTIKVEYNPNRPDFSSPEGIARALKGYYGLETGLPTFPLRDSGLVITVDPVVNQVRPCIVTAVVKNVGDRAGDEVAELYVKHLDPGCVVPHHELRGFERLSLEAGEAREVSFTLGARELSVIDEQGQRVLVPGRVRLFVGGSQPDARSVELMGRAPLAIELELAGERTVIPY